MKRTFIIIVGLFLLCRTGEIFGVVINVPSLGTIVREADTILKGRFVLQGSNVFFNVEETIKGKPRSSEAIKVTTVSFGDRGFDLSRYVTQLYDSQSIILGLDRGEEIYLPWYTASVWPKGISIKWPQFGDVDACEQFIYAMMEYEELAQLDKHLLISRLLIDLQADSPHFAALGYLDSNPPIFRDDRELEHHLLSIVAALISSSRIYDKWTSDCMFSLYPKMPVSITLPYFLEIAKNDGAQGKLALSAVKSSLKARKLPAPDVLDLDSILKAAAFALPSLRANDARKLGHLFDAGNDHIAEKAPLVFSKIFDEPRPVGKNAGQEKEYWMNKIPSHQK